MKKIVRTSFLLVVTAFALSSILLVAQSTISSDQQQLGPWADADVGTPKIPGTVQQNSGVLRVSSSGGDFGTSESLHISYQQLTGDLQMTTRVVSHPNGTAGIVVRNGLASDAQSAFFGVNPANQIVFIWRLQNKEQSQRDVFSDLPMASVPQFASSERTRWWNSQNNQSNVNAATPVSLKLIRQGNDFSCFVSADGTNWQWVCTERIPLPQNVLAGIGLMGADGSNLSEATFDQTVVDKPARAANLPNGTGRGLSASFVSSETSAQIQRTVPDVNFNWSRQERRLPGFGAKGLNATFDGFLEAPQTDVYALQLNYSGSIKLILDNQLIIEDSKSSVLRQSRIAVPLQSGKRYPLHLEYQQGDAHAVLRLLWSSPSIHKQSIPSSQLYPAFMATSAAETKAAVLSLTNWATSPIGAVTNTSVSVNVDQKIKLLGGGGLMGRPLDDGNFLYQASRGDIAVSAQVTPDSVRSKSGRVGLMMRESLRDGSPMVFLQIDPKNRVRLQYRRGADNGKFLGPFGTTGRWLKLVRRGDTFAAFKSDDGVKWKWFSSIGVPMGSNAFVGAIIGSSDPDSNYDSWFAGLTTEVPATSDAIIGAGDGLAASYLDASGNATQQIDPDINFVWAGRTPANSVGGQRFNALWEGLVQAQYDETYRIDVQSDSKARVFFDGKKYFDGTTATPEFSVPGAIERRFKVRLKAGQYYAIRIEYEGGGEKSKARLLWSSPSTPQQPIPQTQLFSPQSDSYAAIVDKDHDGLPDAWEVAHGLNPYDASDASLDADGDGLSNMQEFQAGTDPQNVDTDGDGFTDGEEVNDLGSNPLAKDLTDLRTVAEATGAAAVNQAGTWISSEDTLKCISARGWVEYTLHTSTANMFQLEVEGGSTYTEDPNHQFDLLMSVDGENLGRVLLVANNPGGVARVLTPWLAPGDHQIRIFWDNAVSGRSLTVAAVRFQQIVGQDLNGNGVSDWIETRLNRTCAVDVAPQFTTISPACIEGRGDYLTMMSISGNVIPQPSIDHRWYSNVPLSPDQPTTVLCSFENGGLQTSNQIVWVPLNVLQAKDQTIRVGDTLMLTAQPAVPNAKGQVSVVVGGTPAIQLPDSRNFVYRFDQAGDFQVTSTYVTGGGSSQQSNTITVHVVPTSLGDATAAWAGKPRTWTCRVPKGVTLQPDSRVTLRLTNKKLGKYTLTVDQPETRQVLARIGSAGSIIGRVPVQGFRLFGAYETGVVRANEFSDGSQQLQMGLVLSPVLPEVSTRIELLAGGVLFEDGSTVKKLSAADFDELGRATIGFVQAANSKTSVCHELDAYQDSIKLGVYP